MRINPIRETNYPNYNSFQTKKLTHKSANSASITDLSILNQNYNQIRINFRGVPNTSLELIKQIPLEDRLASLFQNFRLGDLILVGKNLQDCAKKMPTLSKMQLNEASILLMTKSAVLSVL